MRNILLFVLITTGWLIVGCSAGKYCNKCRHQSEKSPQEESSSQCSGKKESSCSGCSKSRTTSSSYRTQSIQPQAARSLKLDEVRASPVALKLSDQKGKELESRNRIKSDMEEELWLETIPSKPIKKTTEK